MSKEIGCGGLEDSDLATKLAKLVAFLGRETLLRSIVDVVLLHPSSQRLGGDPAATARLTEGLTMQVDSSPPKSGIVVGTTIEVRN